LGIIFFEGQESNFSMRSIFLPLMLSFGSFLFGQHNTHFLSSYYKDRLLDNSNSQSYRGNSFFPIVESTYPLNDFIKDSSLQYYQFTETLFKHHLFEFTGKDYFLTISPIIDISAGKDFADTSKRRLFQNTRGIHIEGDLNSKFSFSTSIFENQARFTRYESTFYSTLGEMYPSSNGSYITQNAVIPGSGRTKYFKSDGFDYAYAVGNIIYKPAPYITIIAGNTNHFIGEGYRSMLLSDNSAPSPFIRCDLNLKRWEFNYLRFRGLNLIRKPITTSVEAYYEAKPTAINFFTFHASKNFRISFFEGTTWLKDDAGISKTVSALYYNPLPGLAKILIADTVCYSLSGLNLSLSLRRGTRIYAQLATGNYSFKSIAYQLGFRTYKPFGINHLLFQFEHNSAFGDIYVAANKRLSFSHYNLALAHVKGTNFREFLIRVVYEKNRIFIESKSTLYSIRDYKSTSLLGIDMQQPQADGLEFIQQIDLGYRVNPKMNFMVFINWQLRSDETVPNDLKLTNMLNIGLRTGVNNHYNDF